MARKPLLLRRWKKVVRSWRRRLWLNRWNLDIDLAEKRGPEAQVKGASFETAARTEYATAYQTGSVTLYRRPAQGEDDDWLSERACHELTHLLVAPLRTLADDIADELPPGKRKAYRRWISETDEHVTSDIARIFLWSVRPNGWRDA